MDELETLPDGTPVSTIPEGQIPTQQSQEPVEPQLTTVEPSSALEAVQGYKKDLTNEEIIYSAAHPSTPVPLLDETRRFAGVNTLVRYPTADQVQTLRKNQSDPYAILAFNKAFGNGGNVSNQYLKVPSSSDISTLLRNRDQPDAREAFDALYGNTSRPWIEFVDPGTTQSRRAVAARNLSQIYTGGYDASAALEYNAAGEVIGAAQHGVGESVDSLLQSARITDSSILPTDTRVKEHPVIDGLVQGVTQFLTGRAVVGGALGWIKPAQGLSTAGKIVREMSLDGLTNAFAFNPDDPLVSDAVKQVAQYATGNPESLNWLYSIKDFNSEAAKRSIRALEQTGLTAVARGVISGLGWGYSAIRKGKAGNIDAAIIDKEKSAAAFEQASKDSEINTPSSTEEGTQARPGEQKTTPIVTEESKPSIDLETVKDKTPSQAIEGIIQDEHVGQISKLFEEPESPLTKVDEYDPIRSLVREIPDFEGRTLSEIKDKVGPFVDQMSTLASTDIEKVAKVLSETFTMDEFKKLTGLFNSAERQAKVEVQTLKESVKDLLSRGEGAAADQIINTDLKQATELADKLNSVNKPFGSAASDLLNIQKLKFIAVNNKEISNKVDSLVTQGMSASQIAKVLSEELNSVDARVDQLTAARAAYQQATTSGTQKEIMKASTALRKAERSFADSTTSKFRERANAIIDALVELSINAKLSGLHTLTFVQPFGNILNTAMMVLYERAGELAKGDLKSIMRSNLAMGLAFRAENTSAIQAMLNFSKWAFKDAKSGHMEGTSNTIITEVSTPRARAISSYNLGKAVPDAIRQSSIIGAGSSIGRAVSQAVDSVGNVINIPSKAMVLADSFLGKIAAHIEIGADKASYFYTEVADRQAQIKTILNDEHLTTSRRSELQDELTKLSTDPTIVIGGKQVTLNDFVSNAVKSSFDSEGHITDPVLSRTVDVMFMKDSYEVGAGKYIENAFGNNISRLFLTPFVRQPIRGMQRGLELLLAPGHYALGKWGVLGTEFAADANGLNGIRRQNIARGKALIGAAFTTWIIDKVLSGEVTGPGPFDPKQAHQWRASGFSPNLIKIGGGWHNYSPLDPLSYPINTIHSIYTGLAMQNLKLKGDEGLTERIVQTAGIIAGGFAVSIIDKPAFSTVSTLSKFMSELGKSSDTDDKLSTKVGDVVGSWSAGMVPNILKEFSTMIDPSVVNPMTFAQEWSRALSITSKDDIPHSYSITGEPLQAIAPYRGFGGSFVSVNSKDLTPRLKVEVQLRQIGNLTGQDFTMQPIAPDPELKGVNLATIQSKVSSGTVFDRLQQEMSTIELGGKKMWEAYKDVLDFNDKSNIPTSRVLAAGNRTEKGELGKVILDIHHKYKQAAWSIVKSQELSAHNTPIEDNIKVLRNIKRDAHNASKDKTPSSLLGVTITNDNN